MVKHCVPCLILTSGLEELYRLHIPEPRLNGGVAVIYAPQTTSTFGVEMQIEFLAIFEDERGVGVPRRLDSLDGVHPDSYRRATIFLSSDCESVFPHALHSAMIDNQVL